MREIGDIQVFISRPSLKRGRIHVFSIPALSGMRKNILLHPTKSNEHIIFMNIDKYYEIYVYPLLPS